MEFELFQKLVQANAIDSLTAQNITDYHSGNANDTVDLDREVASQLENGVIPGRFLEYVARNMDKHKQTYGSIDTEALTQINQSNSRTAKSNNWKIIFKEVDKLGIQIDEDTNKQVTRGDIDMITDLLKRVSEFISEKTEKRARKKRVKEGVDILSMDPNRKPTKCDSSLEIILNTLCRNFNMKPKQ